MKIKESFKGKLCSLPSLIYYCGFEGERAVDFVQATLPCPIWNMPGAKMAQHSLPCC